MLPSSYSLEAISWLSSNLESPSLILNEIFFFQGISFLLVRGHASQPLGPGRPPFRTARGGGGGRGGVLMR